jgi:hypothetical protein
MKQKKWVKQFFILSFLVMIFTSGINYLVNPYNVFGHGYDSHFLNKTEILSDEMTKFYIANRLQPKTIMVGTSRIGFFKSEQLSHYAPSPIYNMALAGSSVNEQALYIEYMIKHHPIKQVIWSLDFFSFNPTKPNNPPFVPERLSQKIYWEDYTTALLSFTTLERSFKTVKNNLSQPTIIQEPSQPFNQDTVISNIRYTLKEYSTQELFLKSEPFKTPSSIDKNLARFKQTIDFCHEHNVSVVVYTSPVYYQHLNLYYSMGLGNTFTYWKYSLAQIHPYTDFCTYSTLSFDTMKFRDSTHTIRDVGVLVFARIFHSNSLQIPQDFGFLVTPTNVVEYLHTQPKKNIIIYFQKTQG